jgi:hypothetical protein
MSESTIFKYANDISMNRKSNSARSVTTGGYARTHKLGPSLISLDVDLPLLTEEQYLEVENELFSIDDGIEFLTVNLSSNNGNNIMNKATVPLKTGETEIKVIKDSHSTLKQFILVNLQPSTDNIFKVGDFIQFDNHDKVYQIFKPIGSSGTTFSSSNAGTCKVRLSTPLVTNVGINPSGVSTGSSKYYYHIQGDGDIDESVKYSWTTGTGSTQNGLITFKNSITGNTHVLSDGTNAVINIPTNDDTGTEIYFLIRDSIAGNENNAALTTEQKAQNNKIGEILNSVTYFAGNFIEFSFSVSNVRPELTIPSRSSSQSLYNPVVNSTLVNPFIDGLITIKNPNGTTAKDPAGNDLTITIPKSNTEGDHVYNYLKNTIMATNSTHPIKTNNVWLSISSGSYIESFNEPLVDSSGKFIVQWGYEYDGCTIEYTTPTAGRATNYNNYNFTQDTVLSVNSTTKSISITNATETYTAGQYVQPTIYFASGNFDQRILSVSVNGDITTINFDTTYNSSTAGWSNGYSISILDGDALSSSIGFITEVYQSIAPTYYTGSAKVLMGPDVNIKLMLTDKPGVTIIPRDENENLYKYNSFKFMEVL